MNTVCSCIEYYLIEFLAILSIGYFLLFLGKCRETLQNRLYWFFLLGEYTFTLEEEKVNTSDFEAF